MIIPDKKKMATMIVAHLPGMAEEEAEGEMGGDMEGLAGELVKAVKSEDAAAVADAFKAMFMACESYEDTEGEG